MSKDNGSRSSTQRNGANSLWVGLLAGMVIGVGLAAAVAWFMKKSPSPFLSREQPALAQPESTLPAIPVGKPDLTSSDDKQRFQFYKILTDKQNTTSVAPAGSAGQSKPAKPQAAAFQPQILQAGSFPSVTDAENLKAKLALLGVEASIQTATIKDKGVWYRVRLGPYKSAQGFLKQNGVSSTPMRVQ